MVFLGREGVMEIGDGSCVPRVAGHGTCQETVFVVNKAGDDHFHKLSRELGERGWGCLGCPGGTTEQPLDSGLCSIPKSVNEEFTHCHSVNARRSLNGVQNHLSMRRWVFSQTLWLLFDDARAIDPSLFIHLRFLALIPQLGWDKP